MNQPINTPTSFVSFKKLASAPTKPKTIETPPTIVSPTDYMVNKPSVIDYVPLAVGLGVVYMMFKY